MELSSKYHTDSQSSVEILRILHHYHVIDQDITQHAPIKVVSRTSDSYLVNTYYYLTTPRTK